MITWGREESAGPPYGKTTKCSTVSGSLLFRKEKNNADAYEKCSYLRTKILKSLALMRKNNLTKKFYWDIIS